MTKFRFDAARAAKQLATAYLHGSYQVLINGKDHGTYDLERGMKYRAGDVIDMVIDTSVPPGPKRRNLTVTLQPA